MRIASCAVLAGLLCLTSCWKRTDWGQADIPPNTLIVEFSQPIKYVFDIAVDGEKVPVKYTSRNRVLKVTGLKPGVHHFNMNSLSYVFGPEFERFKVDEAGGAYFFVQTRKYRSAIPKSRDQVSIRAYRKSLAKDKELQGKTVKAVFL